MCLDSSFAGIDTPATFQQQISDQLELNPLAAFNGFFYAVCLTWPNLTTYDLQRYTGPFPEKLKNSVLVIGITNDAAAAFPGALATYEYIGSDNAALLIHDSFGATSLDSINNCTNTIITAYFTQGINHHQKSLTIGVLPESGVTCRTDLTGLNNPLIKGWSGENGESKIKKMAIGLGIGVGVLLVVGLSVVARFWMRSRKERRRIQRDSHIKLNTVEI